MKEAGSEKINKRNCIKWVFVSFPFHGQIFVIKTDVNLVPWNNFRMHQASCTSHLIPPPPTQANLGVFTSFLLDLGRLVVRGTLLFSRLCYGAEAKRGFEIQVADFHYTDRPRVGN